MRKTIALADQNEEDPHHQAYGAKKYDRLKSLKRRYDPDNLFRSTRT